MNKTELIKQLSTNHKLFIHFINSLADKQFNSQFEQKWTAGKELDHIVKSVAPLANILSSKTTIIDHFGKINRPILNYNDLKNRYRNEFKMGGIATGKFVPEEEIKADKKSILTKALLDNVKLIENNLTNFTEDELDNLVLPHPLLGNLAIREMIFFTIYHVEHHQQNLKRNIEEVSARNKV